MKKWIFVLVLAALLAGCTSYAVKFRDPNNVVIAQVDMIYLFQDKDFDKLAFDPNTNQITVTNFGSETSQIVGEAIRAARGLK